MENDLTCDAHFENRRYDRDGQLHIRRTPISKATVNPYYGREIPLGEKLGLKPDRVYYMLRDPGELAKAAPTFANKQLMFKHISVSAEDPKQDSIAGTIGTDVAFEAPYLVADMAVWDEQAIAGIETDVLRELSASYHYRADMTPGVYEGQPYDGVMRDIEGNHVALVEVGRAGHDVKAADSQLETKMEKKFAKTANDSVKEEDRISRDAQTASERAMWAQMRKDGTADDPEDDSMPASLRKASDRKTAKDKKRAKDETFEEESEEDEDEPEKAGDRKKAHDAEEDDDEEDEKRAADAQKMCEDSFDDLVGKLEKKGYSKEYATKVAGKVAKEKGDDGGRDSKRAKDRRAKDAEKEDKAEDRAKHAMDEFKRELREAEEARRSVRPIVGDVYAYDSAGEIYAFALDQMKVDRSDVTGTPALRALFHAAHKAAQPAPRMAFDSAGLENKFPGAVRKINVM